jgi:hypothetical protein
MLVEFRVENHRSLRDEQVLTMEAGRIGNDADSRPRRVPGHAESLLPVAVLYGANASGKSNVLSALAFMQDAVIFSHRRWSSDEGVPRDPFAWGLSRTAPSLFEVTVVVADIRYEYGFSASDDCFLEEWLHAWPNGKKQVWFERDKSTFKFGDHFKGENKVIEEVTRPNALFLSAAIQHRHSQLMPIFSWFATLEAIKLSAGRHSFSLQPTELEIARMLREHAAYSQQQTLFPNEAAYEPIIERFRTFLRNADIGIVDLRVAENQSDDQPRRHRIPRFSLKHASKSENSWLPLEDESHGTRTLFSIALPILRAIEDGSMLLIDELEASLHPSLAQQIVRQFNDPATNPNNAQLIFTTHDTNLLGTTLGEPALRRDQVWLTEKNTDGATVLYPLTDYMPRKAENLERGYLQGRYGAIPFLGDFSLLGT